MHTFLVGLTGGIGSGKSVAAELFARHGTTVVDADLASRAVVEPGQPALAEIATHFGAQILTPDGSLDRTALRHRVFAEPSERKWLQGLLHPLISEYLRDAIAQSQSAYTLLVNPLLLESGQDAWCARVLVIDAPEAAQLERTMQRDNNTREQVENIMRAQAERSARLARADDVISNDADMATLAQRVDAQHEEYLKLCQTVPAQTVPAQTPPDQKRHE